MPARHGAFLVAFCLLLAAPASAQQGVITGRVTDAETGAPLSEAQVQALGATSTGSLTNERGTYRMQVPAGTYAVVVQIIGHESARVDGVGVDAGETETVDFQLASRVYQLNPVVVTGSRRQEKALESPSTIVTIGQERIEERAAVSPVEHLKTLPGVDVSQTGLTQANVVTRGFNNVFSGSLLTLVDNRYAHVPSLRVNAYNMIPTNQMDVERVEVLLGPAAALYGPNSASGVLHIITSSPLDDPGGEVSVAAGLRSVFQTQFRYATALSENTGFKVSGEYFTGEDWEYEDPVERAARAQALASGADPATLKIGARDFDAERYAGEARFDWRPWSDGEVILNAGVNQLASSIELTGQGAGQADDWRYSYAQARLNKGRFFAQAFINQSDAGDTYLLRSGNSIVDKSRMIAGQIQHGFALGDRQDFIYGIDLQRTEPRTEGTITGRNEDDDIIDEVGGYVHSETALSDKVDLVAALRVDDHSRLDDLNWSPRAALVFHPEENQSFRLTFNRAFSTPTTNNLFLDLVAVRDPFGLGNDLRTLGVPADGFTFTADCAAGLMGYCMYSPFVPGTELPANAEVLWDGILQALAARQPTLAPLLPLLANPGGALGSVFRSFNAERAAAGDANPFDPDTDGPVPVDPIVSTKTTTYEVGYKGIIGGRLLLTADAYVSQIKDFVGPLRVETPSVFFDPATLQAFVQGRLTAAAQAGLIPPQQVAPAVEGIVSNVARIPVGTVAPDQAPGSDLLLTYRNFGDVDLWGSDLAFQFLASDQLSFTGSWSYVSEECFDFDEDGDCTSVEDISVNAPQNKGSLGVRWDDDVRGLTLEGRARFTEEFVMNSGVYAGLVGGYTVFDANVAYQLSALPGTSVMLTATNLFDNEHREFVGAPELGRMVLLRLKYEF